MKKIHIMKISQSFQFTVGFGLMNMVDPIVSFALEKLDDFITRELESKIKLRKDAKWLRSELGFLQSFLQEAGGCPEADRPVWRHLLWEIKDIADETVALLAKYRQNEGKSGGAGWIGCGSLRRHCCGETHAFDIGEEMEFLKERVMEVSRRKSTYETLPPNFNGGLMESEAPRSAAQSRALMGRALRRATSYMDPVHPLVGLEDVKRSFLAELRKDHPRDLSIVSVYGMGGLGKTTLAKDLYMSSEIVSAFPKRAWTCVSQENGVSEVRRSVVKSFKKGCSPRDLETIALLKTQGDIERYLRELLDGHKYLVVMDDVWEREVLTILKRSFPDFGNGSRIMVTTRKEDVAMGVDGTIFAYQLRFLNPKESWKLFTQKFSDEYCGVHVDHCSDEIKGLANDILLKCGGLPLAIVVLRGLLAHKRPEEWFKVKENIWSYLQSDSIEISDLLSLSYHNLSRELQDCFLYLGVFPETQAIDSEKLMHLWMAEGFITPGRGRTMEDVAEDYLMELINRSLIQVEKRFWGKISKVSVHDLLHRLAEEKALEVNFFSIYDQQTAATASPSFHISCRRHVVRTEVGVDRYFNAYGFSEEFVVSIHLLHNRVPPLSSMEGFQKLSVLNLEGDDLSLKALCQSLPTHVQQLKFLGLTNTNPNPCVEAGAIGFENDLGELKNLQTLQVLSHDVTEACVLPPTAFQLMNLRHIIARVDGEAEQIGTLSNLTILRTITYRSWNTVKAENLQNLRELVIDRIDALNSHGIEQIGLLSNLDTLVLSSMGEKGPDLFPNLDSLSSCSNLRRLWLDGIVGPFETWPQSITMLKLSNGKVNEVELIRIVEKLPNLRCMDLYDSYTPPKLVFSSEGFPRLEFLSLSDIHGLQTLELEEGAAPKIKAVYVKGCPKLSNISEKLESVRVSENEMEIDFMFVFHCYPRIL